MKSPFSYYGVPVNDFSDQLRTLVNSLLTEKPDGANQTSIFPLYNLSWDEDKVMLTVEIPGVTKEDLDIQLEGLALTISGERKNKYEGKMIRNESFSGKFSRTIKLPYAVVNESANAQNKNGILTLVLFRKEESKPKKININVL
jgi:HSP20 family protein